MQDCGPKCYLCHMPYNVRPLSGMGPLPRVWEAQMAESAAGDALFERTEKVSFVQVLPHALQHVLAAFAGIVTPAIIIASVCGFTPQEEASVIQASLVLSALDIFLQQFPIKHPAQLYGSRTGKIFYHRARCDRLESPRRGPKTERVYPDCGCAGAGGAGRQPVPAGRHHRAARLRHPTGYHRPAGPRSGRRITPSGCTPAPFAIQ